MIDFMTKCKKKFAIKEKKVKRSKSKKTCRRTEFRNAKISKQEVFLKEVFEYLQNKLENGEKLYRLKNCLSDGLLQLKNGNILIEVKGGKLNWLKQCNALTQLMIASKWIEDKWNIDIDDYWIIAEDFTKEWTTKTLDYPLEYHRFIKDRFGFDVRLMQYNNGQLTEIVA